MSAIQGKAHISLDGYLFMIARNIRKDSHIYGREESPSFVNKFSSGDPNYRDASFFPHFVQNNYVNGFDQEKFNDGGKFWRSSGVDTIQQEKLTLEKRFFAAGLTAAGVKILSQAVFRAAATSAFGDGSDGALIISTNTTDAPIDSACTGSLGATTLVATNASFAAGQVILIHQTQGAGAGQYQKTKISSYLAGQITTVDALAYSYVTGAQVIVMKQYTTITVNSGVTWTAKAWNGTTGGILAVMANGVVTITGTITGTGKGFRGGAAGSNAINSTPAGQAGEGNPGIGATTYATNCYAANGDGGGGGVNGSSPQVGGTGGGGGNGASGTAGTGQAGGIAGAGGGTGGNAGLTLMLFGGAGGGSQGNNDNGGAGGNGGGIIFLFVKTPTVTGSIVANGSNGDSGVSSGAGAGAGGSILIKTATAVLGTSLVAATGGTGGTGGAANGGAGGTGRVHVSYSTSFTGITSPTIDSVIDSTLTDTPAGSVSIHYAGTSDGRIFSWDGASTFTELFSARRFEWFDTGTDITYPIGDVAATENAQAQSFQVALAQKIKGLQVNLKMNAGAPGAITVRIETNNAGVPSGTLVDATNATATIPAFTTATAGWITVEFPAAFSLAATTTYWIVLKTAAAANDNNYVWTAKSTSGYASGNMASSADGGATWTAQAGRDAYFRLLGNTTSVNTMKVSSISGTRKIWIGTGNPLSITNGDAKLYSYDGAIFALVKIFNTTDECSILSMSEFGATTNKMYLGLGATAKVYVTSDFTTFTLSKTITSPDNPGYVFALKEYNGRLYAAGGYPQLLAGTGTQYGGFLYSWDEFNWNKIGEFDHTVLLSMEVFDNLLFLGTIKKRLYVYNTASIDKLLDMPWNVEISSMTKWDDKLVLAFAPTPGYAASGFESIYLFDRSGFHNAFSVTGSSWYSAFVFNNNLMGGDDTGYVYQTDFNTYQASGTMQTSYFEAALPNIDKKWRDLTLIHDALPTGTTIVADYKTDESDASWTNIGTANTVGALKTTFTFAVGFYSKKLSIKLTLTTSVSSSTPTVKVIDMRYVLVSDFKYLWKMKLACPDSMVWLDGTEPISLTTTGAIAATDTTLNLVDGTGFPTKHKGVILNASGVETEIAWTGRTSNQLTGVSGLPTLASGQYTVKMTGRVMHKLLLTLKQTKTLYTFIDIDSLSYTVLFYNYQADDFVVNQTDGLENNAPITLLEG